MSAVAKIQVGSELKPRVRYNADGSLEIAGINAGTLFSPSQPVDPYAQDPRMGAIGRQYDYQTGINLQYSPRGDQSISFDSLRALAENYDLLRLAIETRKDQLASLDWKVRPKDPKKDDDLGDGMMETLAYPDRRNSFDAWQRALLEDMFVIDAATVFPRFTNGGQVYALELVDGATIKPLIDETGRTPLPPSPAYQQVIKGLPAVDYTSEELLYRVRNPRTWKSYGQSPVEQIIMTVNIALRRQMFQLDYYTAGSVPDAFGMLPDTWNPDQVKQFQQWWDSLFENPAGTNSAQRRRMRWTAAKNITFAKDQALKDEYDEWLARVVCYAFNLPPTPFIKQMNRATAQAQADAAKTEGLIPLKRWWKSFMDYLIQRVYRRNDLEFYWLDEEELDPLVSAQIDQINVNSGILTRDEVREERGLEPLPPPADSITLPPGEQVFDANGEPAAQGGAQAPQLSQKPQTNTTAKPPIDGAEKMVKLFAELADNQQKLTKSLAKSAKTSYVERRNTMIQRQRMTRGLKRAFRGQIASIAEQYAAHVGVQKAAGSDNDGNDWFDFGPIFGPVYDAAKDPLKRTAKDGAEYGTTEITSGVTIEPEFYDQYSADYARDRGAEMIGMKWVDGELVDNPDAKWAIDEETRSAIRDMLDKAIQEGWTVDELTSELQDEYAFSADRAENIARTETRMADAGGRQAAWKESGVVKKKVWLIGDDNPCEDCIANADAGEIDIDDDFPSGDDSEPAHPNCLPGDSLVTTCHGITAASKRWFDGDLIIIRTAAGNQLSCTPNHPVLTNRGWVAAGLLNVGSDIVRYLSGQRETDALNLEHQNVPSSIQEIAETFGRSEHVTATPVPTAPEDFHGDGKGSDVAVIWADRKLMDGLNTALGKKAGKLPFVTSDERIASATRGLGEEFPVGTDATTSGSVSIGALSEALFGGHPRSLEKSGFSGASDSNAVRDQLSADTSTVNAVALADTELTLTEKIAFDQVINVRTEPFSGHVYNLQTQSGWYVADGIITHNCNCVCSPIVASDEEDDNEE